MTQKGFGKPDNGVSRGDRHDDDDEYGLDIADIEIHVSRDRRPVLHDGHADGERDDPYGEDGFDFAQEPEDCCLEADITLFFGRTHPQPLCVIVFEPPGKPLEGRGREDVNHGQQEDHCRNEIERLFRYPVRQGAPQGQVIVIVCIEGAWELRQRPLDRVRSCCLGTPRQQEDGDYET